MTIADKDNPMFNEVNRKKLRQEKKSPLRPMSAKEIRASLGRRREHMDIKATSPCEGQ